MATAIDDSQRARAVFKQACAFVSVRERITEQKELVGRDLMLIYPTLALEAFAIELFLKCLLLLQGEEPPRTHNLAKLFRDLHPNTKRSIVDQWDNGPRKKIVELGKKLGFPTDLPNSLVRCGDAFEELRYAFEDPEKIVFYLGDLPRLLLDQIAAAKPDWVSWHD